MQRSRKPTAAYWNEVRRMVAYADFLMGGGDPRSFLGRELRHNAFGGPGPTLDAMHAELVDPKWRGSRRDPLSVSTPHSRSKNRHTRRRETPSERRRRLAAAVLSQERSSHS